MKLHDAFGPDDVQTVKVIYSPCKRCHGTGGKCAPCGGFGEVVTAAEVVKFPKKKQRAA